MCLFSSKPKNGQTGTWIDYLSANLRQRSFGCHSETYRDSNCASSIETGTISCSPVQFSRGPCTLPARDCVPFFGLLVFVLYVFATCSSEDSRMQTQDLNAGLFSVKLFVER